MAEEPQQPWRSIVREDVGAVLEQTRFGLRRA